MFELKICYARSGGLGRLTWTRTAQETQARRWQQSGRKRSEIMMDPRKEQWCSAHPGEPQKALLTNAATENAGAHAICGSRNRCKIASNITMFAYSSAGAAAAGAGVGRSMVRR